MDWTPQGLKGEHHQKHFKAIEVPRWRLSAYAPGVSPPFAMAECGSREGHERSHEVVGTFVAPRTMRGVK
eukprot:Skav213138  [mRNA]  locus=scaffold107:411577:411977:- [translate_table: standard]